MKSFGAIIVLCVTVCLVQGFPGGDKDGPKGDMMGCVGGNLTIPDTFKTAAETCMKKVKPADNADEETMKKAMSCDITCTGQALGMLDTAGKPVMDKLTAGMKDIFPAAALKDITTEITSCITANEKSLVLKDGDCSSYDEMIKCSFKGIKKVCMPQ